jgi:two-component system, OmpR family, response regulator
LLVEDDDEIAHFLLRGLELEGHAVDRANGGWDALRRALQETYPIIILDLMLPDIDGLEVCERLRSSGVESAILMLTARDGPDAKVAGLRIGADDYLTKPFAFAELVARLEAILRRIDRPAKGQVLRIADLQLDLATKTVLRGTRPVTLTATEFALLEHLMRNAGKVLGRADLLRAVWNRRADLQTNVVEVYIRYLRLKIDGEGETAVIRTVRGFGYTIDAPSITGPPVPPDVRPS